MEFLTDIFSIELSIGLMIALFARQISTLGTGLLARLQKIGGRGVEKLQLRKFKYIKKVRYLAQNPVEVLHHSVRCYVFGLCFLLCCLFYLSLVISGPLKMMSDLPTSVQLFIEAPIFIFEVLWLKQREFARDLRIASERPYKRAEAKRKRQLSNCSVVAVCSNSHGPVFNATDADSCNDQLKGNAVEAELR
ncbi:hypothetical protein [Aliamphritea ceti]|uniref:hypothetical protein n=1 Tax=Aliamphritea ceti TaxID=1524258 RepID=UPI0021C26258|nr:hypothetical protein [Aliamphritea ceti]